MGIGCEVIGVMVGGFLVGGGGPIGRREDRGCKDQREMEWKRTVSFSVLERQHHHKDDVNSFLVFIVCF
jgi:hypothetical protein